MKGLTKLTIILSAVAALWWVSTSALGPRSDRPAHAQALPVREATGGSVGFVWPDSGRDPFFCAAFMDAPRSAGSLRRAGRPADRAATPEAVLPECSVGGIVYNESSPMAILLKDGASTLVKKGDVVDSIEIRGVSQGSVTVAYRGKTFVLNK